MDPLLYKPLYLHLAVLLSMVVAALPYPDDGRLLTTRRQKKGAVWIIAAILILWIGLRPIHGTFIDTMNYARSFKESLSSYYTIESDVIFNGIIDR